MNNTAGFISHGAPDIILGNDGALASWKSYLGSGTHFRGIVVISAHWMEKEITLSANPHPATIHDFGGFPEELYRMKYPASGSQSMATDLNDRIFKAGWRSKIDLHRGLDHGVWIPLMAMLPDCSLPVVPISLSREMGAESMFQFGRDLHDIMGDDLFFLASGGVTHNLSEARFSEGKGAPWAEEFDRWTVETVLSENWTDLINYRKVAPYGNRNHPTEEHFLPLLSFAGWASRSREKSPGISLSVPHRAMSYYCISMTGFLLTEKSSAQAP
ncbi:MAG: class III extradiol ring-cleavage dioxygenase [Nitrospiraceae bacterium]|nr:class III extradiol ring-cleavage dioxygenase [Nitrospiraceae bacterium]